MKKEVEICDYCEDNLASGICVVCQRHICEDHNLGGEHSFFSIIVHIHSQSVMSKTAKQGNILDLCPSCTNKVKAKPFVIPPDLVKQLVTAIDLWKKSFQSPPALDQQPEIQ